MSWLTKRREELRLSVAELADLVGVKPQTIYNWEAGGEPRGRGRRKALAEALQVTEGELVNELLDPLPGQAGVAGGLAEPEAKFIGSDEQTAKDINTARALHPKGRGDYLVVSGRSLENLGIRPGDRVVIDVSGDPGPTEGCLVVAQRYDEQGGATTLLRIYQPYTSENQQRAWLKAATNDPAIDPAIAEGESVVVMGIVTATFRHT